MQSLAYHNLVYVAPAVGLLASASQVRVGRQTASGLAVMSCMMHPWRLRAGFSGAELANVVNEAALLAGRQGKDAVDLAELIDGVQRTKCASHLTYSPPMFRADDAGSILIGHFGCKCRSCSLTW